MPHVVEVFYSEHCPSCPFARAVARRLASGRNDIVVIERDVDQCPELVARYHLLATPALVIDRHDVLYGVPRLEVLAARLALDGPVG